MWRPIQQKGNKVIIFKKGRSEISIDRKTHVFRSLMYEDGDYNVTRDKGICKIVK
jgi:hypothetical protein